MRQHCLVIELDQLYRTNPIISSLDPVSTFLSGFFLLNEDVYQIVILSSSFIIKSYKRWSHYEKASDKLTENEQCTLHVHSVFLLYFAQVGKCTLELTAKDQPSDTEVMPRQGFSESPPEIFCLARILLALLSRAD